MKPWHDDDEFWTTWRPFMFTEKHWEKAPADIDGIINLLELKPGRHILDLCCGPGRHALELARRGFKVTGVDRTKVYLDEARKRAKKEKLDIEFVQEDMRKFCRLDSFDVALNLYTSFSYFKDPEEDKQVLKNVYASLKKEGTFVIQMMGKEVLARIFIERDWEEKDGVYMLAERRVTKDWSWMENRWIMVKGKEVREFKVEHRLYSGSELASLLKEVGFRKVDIYGDLTGAPYNNEAKLLVGVAVK